jgi:uncharacterized protein (TIRG00374 family)
MNLRRLLILAGTLGVIVLIFSTFGNPATIVSTFERGSWYVVPLVIAAQLASYYYNAGYYQAFFAIFGHKTDLRRLYEASLGINFAGQAIPSGGVASTTYLAQAVKEYGVPPSQATLAQIGRYIFTFASYFVVLAFGFITLLFSNDLNKVSVRVMILVIALTLAGGVMLMAVFSERSRLEALVKPIINLINAFGRRCLRRRRAIVSATRLDRFLTEFYRGYHEIIENKHNWPALFWWSLGGNLAEVATVYAVFVGFGHWVNPGVVIVAYTLAIAASVGGFLVNGLGVYEAGMIGAFAALGVPFALAFDVVLVYRILNFVLFLPPGLHYYRKHLK